MYWPMGRGRGRGRCRGCGFCRLSIAVSIVFVVYSSIYVVVCMMSILLSMLLSMSSSKRWGREMVQAIDHREHKIGICRQSKQKQKGVFQWLACVVVVVKFMFVAIVAVVDVVVGVRGGRLESPMTWLMELRCDVTKQ